MCSYLNGSLPNMPCVNRACKNSEMKPVELLQLFADYRDESLKWYVWEYVWLLKNGEKRIMSCVEKTTTVAVFLESLQNDMKVHTFSKRTGSMPRWDDQSLQFIHLKHSF